MLTSSRSIARIALEAARRAFVRRRREGKCGDLLYRTLAVSLAVVIPLKAYTDPGSGILLWQVAGAFFVGCAYQVRKFFIRLRKR
jgi:hypothetical protein